MNKRIVVVLTDSAFEATILCGCGALVAGGRNAETRGGDSTHIPMTNEIEPNARVRDDSRLELLPVGFIVLLRLLIRAILFRNNSMKSNSNQIR
jgi:hypothetical protein